MRPTQTYLLLTLTAVFWGGTFVAGRQLAPLLDPVASAFLRFAMATVLLLFWLYLSQGRLPRLEPRQLVAVVLLGASGVLLYNLLFFAGLETVEAGRAALIIAANPVLIAVASAMLFKEPMGASRFVGVLLSLAGAIVVISRGDLPSLLNQGVGQGELMLLGCVLSWVVYTLLGRRMLRRLSPLLAVAYASLAGTLMLGAVFFWRGGMPAERLADPTVWLSLVYLAVFGTVLAFVWFYAGVKAIGAARAGQFIYLVPVSGVFLGAVLLDEPLTASLLFGGCLVIAGLWLTNRPDAARQLTR